MLVHDFCVWLRDPLAVLLAPTERPSVCSAARASRAARGSRGARDVAAASPRRDGVFSRADERARARARLSASLSAGLDVLQS